MSWICPKCETENPNRLKVCEVCDSPRELSPVELLKKRLREKYSDAAYKSFIRYHYSLLESADNGDVSAQYRVGDWFYSHEGVGMSDCYRKIAVMWYIKAAEQGHIEAQFKLGLCYEEGSGVLCDKAEAIKWYKKAADQGSRYAIHNYLKLKYNGKNYEQVIKYREQLCFVADDGYIESQYALGEWFNNHNKSAYKEEAFLWYSKAAKKGHHAAMYKLAECYENGRGVYSNIDNAIKWYKKAAKAGNIPARKKLAESYLYGKLVQKNVTEALNWFDMTWEEISADDLCNIGYAYDTGDTIPIDKAKAVKYYRMAAEKGDSTAQYNLGICYENGTGVTKNIDTAMCWYEKASNNDNDARDRLSALKYAQELDEQNQKGCVTYIITGIISFIGLILLINAPENSWAHQKDFLELSEYGTEVWMGTTLLVFFITGKIVGYEH